jgi:hypothetical protein
MAVPNRKYFVDVFQDIIDRVCAIYDPINEEKPYAYYGSIIEILQVVSEKDNDGVSKYKKYPFVALILDLEETRGTGLANEYMVSPRIIGLIRGI